MKAELDFVSWGPRDYISPMPFIHPDWKVADVGPGGYPHPRANVYIDHDETRLEALKESGKEVILANLEDGLPMIEDDAFSYVWCSHVFEHLRDPLKAAATLSRIAKRGTIVMPSFAKEALFLFEEPAHLWLVHPNPTTGRPPIFVERNNAFLQKLRDPMVQKAMCFLYRTGTHHDCTAERHLRAFYQEHEPDLDVVHHWRDELKIQVIR